MRLERERVATGADEAASCRAKRLTEKRNRDRSLTRQRGTSHNTFPMHRPRAATIPTRGLLLRFTTSLASSDASTVSGHPLRPKRGGQPEGSFPRRIGLVLSVCHVGRPATFRPAQHVRCAWNGRRACRGADPGKGRVCCVFLLPKFLLGRLFFLLRVAILWLL